MSLALPSVTQILSAVGLAPDFQHVEADTLERARSRGKALHKAIFLHNKGTLDESSLHEEIVPGFEAYRSFAKACGFRPIASEIELVHPTWGFLGHPDCVGYSGVESKRVVVDFKYVASFDKPYVQLQGAGYRLLWDARYPGEPIDEVLGLHLKRDGNFALYNLTDDNAKQVFLAAVVVYRALQERGKA